MLHGQGTVFVLGAGFTKAFLPKAPLLEDDYGGPALLKELEGKEFRHAREILEQELYTCGGNINIERLMTRLHGRMPYDVEHRADKELDLLLSLIEQRFINRIKDAMGTGEIHTEALRSFASHCIMNGTHCITFNYDELLDQALWEYRPRHGAIPNWSPDRGYGFACRISEACIRDVPGPGGPSSMLLLKLHGSTNWRVPLGYAKPYPLEVVRHHETWFESYYLGSPKIALDVIDPVLEPDPVMIPPVLSKSSLVEQPMLRFLWSRAYDVLSAAKHVVFIGYSLPITDMSAGYLFREGLRHLDQAKEITVVDYARNEQERTATFARIHLAYRNVFPKISEDQFDLAGARSWMFNNLTAWLYDSKGTPIAFLVGKHVFDSRSRFIGDMIDSEIVWGEGPQGQSPYKGEMEGNRLVFREESRPSLKHVSVVPAVSPGVPTFPECNDAIVLRPGLRDVVLG